MRLGLGTAQLGMDYGLTNKRGRPAAAEAVAWLRRAHDSGVELVDTAPGYGSAEEIVGAAIKAGCRFDVVTKIPRLQPGCDAGTFLANSLSGSLARLGVHSIDAVLLHHWQDVVGPQGGAVVEALLRVRYQGLVRKIGVSVYRGGDIDEVLSAFTPDVVQLPFSALDQRLWRSGHLERLRDRGVEIHARSIFAQGVLLSSPAELPAFLARLGPSLEKFRALAREHALTELEAAVAFVTQRPFIAAMIVGVSGPEELEALLRAFAVATKVGALDYSSLAAGVPEDLLDLDRWPAPPAAAPAH